MVAILYGNIQWWIEFLEETKLYHQIAKVSDNAREIDYY